MKHLRDPDRVPVQFIDALAAMSGITQFPGKAHPEEKRKYLAYAHEIQNIKALNMVLSCC